MLIVSDKRTHVRCRKCQARRVLSRAPNRYLRPPVCRTPGCGSRDYRVDRWMERRPTGVNGFGCACGGHHFVHRKGSPYCRENPLAPLLHCDRQGDPPESLLRIARELAVADPSVAPRVAELCERWGLQ